MNRIPMGSRAFAVLAVLAAAPVAAQPSSSPDTEGFFLGLGILSSHLDSVDESADAVPGSVFIDDEGGGLALTAGWAFTPSFALRLALAGARHDTTDPDVEFAYGTVTLEGVYLFRDPEPFRPYVAAGLGGMSARAWTGGLDFETTGPGLVFGGGFLWFPGTHFALDVGARVDLVNWEEQRATLDAGGSSATVTRPIEEDGFAARLGVGGSWWF